MSGQNPLHDPDAIRAALRSDLDKLKKVKVEFDAALRKGKETGDFTEAQRLRKIFETQASDLEGALDTLDNFLTYFRCPASFPWPPVLFGCAIGVAWVLDGFTPLSWPDFLAGPPAQTAGYFLCLVGIVLIAWAKIRLMRAGTTVWPDAAATVLVIGGPYRLTRHPIYLGLVLILLGLGETMFNAWFLATAAAFVVLMYRVAIMPEEHHMEARFGDAYRSYRACTPRWL
ncbi:MAG: methyltransferase family protein [Hyphomicrobiaceae bacterium]